MSTNDTQLNPDKGMSSGPTNHQAPTAGIALLEDEYVLENVHPSFTSWTKSFVLLVLIALAALGALVNGNVGGFITYLILAGLVGGYIALAQKKSRYIVTTERVKKNIGLLRKSTGETRITDIKSLSTNQGILDRIFSTGTVQIDSTGAGGLLGINGVQDHEKLAQLVRQEMSQHDSTRRQQHAD